MTRFRDQKHGRKTRGIWQAKRLEGKVKNAGLKKILKPKKLKPQPSNNGDTISIT